MPFQFYYAPYSVTRIAHYDPCSYYRRLIDLFSFRSSPQMLARRLSLACSKRQKLLNVARALATRAEVKRYRRILQTLETDPDMRAFHEGGHGGLPDFYRAEFARGLGRYADLLDDSDRTPVLDQPETRIGWGQTGGRIASDAGECRDGSREGRAPRRDRQVGSKEEQLTGLNADD
jgi:hypothetical protein